MNSDLRAIFTKHNIPWRDKGANCSKGNVNIPCVFCKNDPSFHLAVSTEWRGYYCYRNSRHAGSVKFLFRTLKIPLSPFLSNFTPAPLQIEHKDYSVLRYFTPAMDSAEAVAYLRDRLFTDPVAIAMGFGLRTEPVGKWAGRLIIPLTVGWTGRAMRAHLQPRYLANTDESGFFYWCNDSSSVFVVEGSIDGMRLATVTEQFDVLGKCGNKLSPSLLLHLKSKGYLTIYNLPDSSVPVYQQQQDSRTLAAYCSRADILRPKLPPGRKDLGEMTEAEVREWLNSLNNISSLTGQVSGRNGLPSIV